MTVRLDPEIYDRLVHLADFERRTLSAMAEALIVEALDARARADNS